MGTNNNIGFVKEPDISLEMARVQIESLWYKAHKDIGLNPSHSNVIDQDEYENGCRLLDLGHEYE